jgi:hypothetical protein
MNNQTKHDKRTSWSRLAFALLTLALSVASLASAQNASPTPAPPDTAQATANVYLAISFVVGAATAAIIFLALKWVVSLFKSGGGEAN